MTSSALRGDVALDSEPTSDALFDAPLAHLQSLNNHGWLQKQAAGLQGSRAGSGMYASKCWAHRLRSTNFALQFLMQESSEHGRMKRRLAQVGTP